MPVDLEHPRFGRTRVHGSLGPVGEWDCPACGVKNSGRKPELGCAHCGSGDPTKGKAGQQKGGKGREATEPNEVNRAPADLRMRPALAAMGHRQVEQDRQTQPLRILRLIEYLITPGENVDLTLRRSLVGRMDFSWGTLTGTIVDSCDDRQEDLLQLARRQPGVWLANELMMREQDQGGRVRLPPGGRAPENPPGRGESGVAPRPGPLRQEREMPEPPDLGPRVPREDERLAAEITKLGGYVLAYTLALALQTISEELADNMEPLKFLTQSEALALANALMQQIPQDWDPQPEVADGSET